MREKRKLYFEQGAKELWICTEQGDMKFFNTGGKIDPSFLVPDFPKHIEL